MSLTICGGKIGGLIFQENILFTTARVANNLEKEQLVMATRAGLVNTKITSNKQLRPGLDDS